MCTCLFNFFRVPSSSIDTTTIGVEVLAGDHAPPCTLNASTALAWCLALYVLIKVLLPHKSDYNVLFVNITVLSLCRVVL